MAENKLSTYKHTRRVHSKHSHGHLTTANVCYCKSVNVDKSCKVSLSSNKNIRPNLEIRRKPISNDIKINS